MMREMSPDIRVRSEHSEMIPLRYYNKARVKNKWSGCEWSMQGVYIHLSLVTCWENREDFLTESELERFTDMLREREIFLVRGFSLLEEPKAPLRDHIALSGFWEPPTYYQHTIWAVKLLLVSVRQGTGWTSQLKIFYRAKVKALPVVSRAQVAVDSKEQAFFFFEKPLHEHSGKHEIPVLSSLFCSSISVNRPKFA